MWLLNFLEYESVARTRRDLVRFLFTVRNANHHTIENIIWGG